MHSSEISATTSLTIRNVDVAVKEQLRVRAARNGRSMEAELRHILNETVGAGRQRELNLPAAIHKRFLPFGGVDALETLPPAIIVEPFAFDK